MSKFKKIKIGDTVERNMCGLLMPLNVTAVTNDLIYCGPWTFKLETGYEYDPDIGCDGINITSSFLTRIIQ
jgi:hypothetical protein